MDAEVKRKLPVVEIIKELNHPPEKVFDAWKDLGVEFKKEPTKTDWGYEAIFDDTCGNLIQLIQEL
ncbi:MAG: VOC family protein [Balneolaceae bacterium]